MYDAYAFEDFPISICFNRQFNWRVYSDWDVDIYGLGGSETKQNEADQVHQSCPMQTSKAPNFVAIDLRCDCMVEVSVLSE